MKLADNRSGSYKIHAVTISKFLVYRFYGNIDCLGNHIQPNLNSFPKTGVIFTSIKSKKLMKRQLKTLGMVQKKATSNRIKRLD